MEKYLYRRTKASPLWQKLLDFKYPNEREKVKSTPGYSSGVTNSAGNFIATPDYWEKKTRKINPEWRAAKSQVLIYGPETNYSILCLNIMLLKEGKLRQVISKIVKAKTGVAMNKQEWNYFGLDDVSEEYNWEKFEILEDWEWRELK